MKYNKTIFYSFNEAIRVRKPIDFKILRYSSHCQRKNETPAFDKPLDDKTKVQSQFLNKFLNQWA